MSSKSRKKKNITYYAKILIAISLALFIYGLILDFSNEVRLFDPVKDVKTIDKDNGSYTSVDVGSHDDKEPSNISDSGQSQSHVYDIAEVNNNLRNSIQKKYDIVVKYGSETNGYEVGGLTTQYISDQNAINNSLNSLDKTLGLYPPNLFKEIKDGGIPLTIYLINNYSEDSVTGATDSNYSFADISIAVIYPIDETFFHESYHYIERYALKKGVSYNIASWNSYNPSGFTYGNINNTYSYKSTLSANSYFVNNYAQTSAEEDRASTFEYMMASSKASCLNNGMPVWKKATIMSLTIDAALDSVSPNNTEYWERFL